MYLFRFAQVFVLIVATIWAVELCRCYLAKHRKKRVRAGLDTTDPKVRDGRVRRQGEWRRLLIPDLRTA